MLELKVSSLGYCQKYNLKIVNNMDNTDFIQSGIMLYKI
jgi:hypothetical protein